MALARTALAAVDLLQGRLVRLFDVNLPTPFAYFIVCPKAVAAKPKIAAFREWLLAEAAQDAEELARPAGRGGSGRAELGGGR